MRPIMLAMATALAAIVLLPQPADAFNRKVTRACKLDYKRLCPHYKPSSPQLRACMEAKSSEISGVCINALIDEGVVGRGRSSR